MTETKNLLEGYLNIYKNELEKEHPLFRHYDIELVKRQTQIGVDKYGNVIRTSQEILYWIHQLVEERIECSKWGKAWRNKDRIKELNARHDSLLKEMTVARERELGIKKQTGPKWQAIYDKMEEESK